MTISTLSDVAIRRAISDVLTGAIAGVRDIGTGHLSGDLVVGASGATASQRALTIPHFTIATSYGPHGDNPQGPTVPQFLALEVTIELTSLLSSQALATVDYDAVKALNLEGGSAMIGAFAWPNKLTTTAAAVETGIVSGVLVHQGMTVVRDTPPPNDGTTGGGLFVTSHRFTGVVRIDRPTS